MKNFLQRKSGVIAAVAGVAALALTPFAAFADSFTGGLILPSSTTSNFVNAITTYLWPTIVNTMFQPILIVVYIILAAAGTVLYIVRRFFHRSHNPHR